MQVNLLRLIAIIILVLPFDLIAAGPIKVQVQAVSVHLFFTPSGEFSEDILKLEGFSSWNFTPTVPIGKTSQQFHSYLIKMRFKKDRGQKIGVRS